MRKQIEIEASFTGAIPTGNYENEKPFFSVREVLEDCGNMSDEEIAKRQEELHGICYAAFKRQADVSYSEKIAKQYQNIRFYDGKGGQKYPSVTSIIDWDADYHMPPDQLAQYGSRGSIIDKQVEVFLRSGKWLEPKDIPECYPDLVILKKGDLGLQVDNVNFQGFYKDYPFKVIDLQKVVMNHEHRYGGRLDILCIIESSNKGKWDKVEGVKFDVLTDLDVKSGAINKTRDLKQQTAYWHANPEIQQVGLIPLNKDVQQGFSKPIIEPNKEKYWSLFLNDRQNFKKRFQI